VKELEVEIGSERNPYLRNRLLREKAKAHRALVLLGSRSSPGELEGVNRRKELLRCGSLESPEGRSLPSLPWA